MGKQTHTISPRSALTESCRKYILQIQIDALHQVVESYKNDNVSIDKMQTILLKLGSTAEEDENSCYDGIIFDKEKEEKEIIKMKVKELNDKSRSCLCRLLLQNSTDLLKDYNNTINSVNNPPSKKDQKIEKSRLLEFLSLFHAMVHLPDVLEYIQYGTSTSMPTANNDNSAQRMHNIQNILLISLGYKPQDVIVEKQVHQLLSSSSNLDTHYEYLINHYLSAIQYVSETTSNSTPLPKLDDRSEGGVTHVISVSLTHQSSSSGAAPPSSLVMPEQKEHNQKSQLETAQQTSMLQEKIRQKLKCMSEDERIEKMDYAKELQDTFLKKAMELPPGLERVRFMQSLDKDDQELLIMYKIYCQEHR